MNKFTLLTIGALAAAMCSCSSGDKTQAEKNVNDSTAVAAESFETTINIRYVSVDSIYKNYTLAQAISQQAQSLANDLQSYQAQLQNKLQSQYNQIQQKAQSNGYLSQASYEADLKELEKNNNSYQNLYAKREQNAANVMDARQKELKDSIDNFLEAYNKEKKYDAILIRDAGLYFNPALDITDEIVKGLNARYKGEKVKGDATDAPAATPSSNLNAPTNPATLNAPSAKDISIKSK